VRRRPGLDAARRYLIELTGRMRSVNQVRLPLLKQMAVLAGVSHSVMGKAAAELGREGALVVRPGRGIVLGSGASASPASSTVPGGSLRWQRLRSQLHQDLTNGRFGSRALPSQKELAGRYGVSQRTTSKALRTLADQGVLAPSGNKYRLAAPVVRTSRNTIVLFARGTLTDELALSTSRTAGQFNALEQICLSRNVRLQVVPCHYGEAGLTFPGWEGGSFSGVFDSTQVLGFVVWRIGLSAAFVRDLAAGLRRFKKPAAIFVEDQTDEPMPGMSSDPLVRRYSAPLDFQAGMAVGAFLISRGHRHISCWSDGSELPWVKERLAGIDRAFADAGIVDGVESFHAWTDEFLRESANVKAVPGHLARTLQRASRELKVPSRDERIAEAASSLYFTWVYREQVFHRLEPSMHEALHRMDATAWVGTNDNVAVECLRYLRANHMKVPQQISVMGFDDSFDAATHRMSSFNFDGAAAANRMVDFLLSPNAPIAKVEAGKPIVMQGFVNERATTGMARGK
jgi:DNA-binding transcriptional regulator YhcF (GntR family)